MMTENDSKLLNLFEYRDYRNYLNAELKRSTSKRGTRSDFARAIGCQPAYVSRVFNGDADLSLEQADKASQYFNHSRIESRYFLCLVSLGRAGTASLRRQFQEQLDEILESRAQLHNRVKLTQSLPMDAQVIYYSAWYYSAIHILTTIPGFGSIDKIAKHLQLKRSLVSEVLRFLESTALVTKAEGRYRSGSTQLHLDARSPLTAKHHSNWRIKTIQNMENQNAEDLHYSSVVSIAKADLQKMRLLLVEAIEKARTFVQSSGEETLLFYGVDLFELISTGE